MSATRALHDSLREASLALDSGHLVRAAATLAALGYRDMNATDRALRDSLFSESLLLGGDNHGALQTAARVIETSHVPSDALARASLVQAIIAADEGCLDNSVRLIERAKHFASLSSDPLLLAKVEVRALATLADTVPQAEAMNHLHRAHHLVHRSADPGSLAHLHVILATFEGRRGLVTRAWKHINIATDVLTHVRNPVVHTLAALTSMIISSLEDDHVATVRFGQEALDSSTQNGYWRLTPRIQNNLALALLRIGALDDAMRLFDEAQSRRLSATSRVGLCDSRAHLCLLTNDLEQCQSLLDEALGVLGTDTTRYEWYRLDYTKPRHS